MNPTERAQLDQMTAACRDYFDQIHVNLHDPVIRRAMRATLSAVLWAKDQPGHSFGWWLLALSETLEDGATPTFPI